MTEKQLHKQICQYLKLQYPKIMFNSDMVGIKLTIGQAIQVKQLRSNNGFPDIFIICRNMLYSGLFLEVKRNYEELFTKTNELRKTDHIREQLSILESLCKEGYCARWVWSFDMAKNIIDDYLSNKLT